MIDSLGFTYPCVFKLGPEDFLKNKCKLIYAQKQAVGLIQNKYLTFCRLWSQTQRLIKKLSFFILKLYEPITSQ